MNKKILVIDDSADIRELLARFLTKKNYSVDLACNGAEALNYLKSSKPDFILLDSQMEIMGGLEFLNELDKNSDETFRTIPIIVLSGESHFIHRRVVQNLRKPIDLSKLADVISSILIKADPNSNKLKRSIH